MEKINIFTCQADASYSWWAWAILAVVLGCCFYELRKFLGNKSNPVGDTDLSGDILNLSYLLECTRLAEQRIAELIAATQSLEKKALAIIAGAAALMSFIVTKDWCLGMPMILVIISIIFCILSIFCAGSILTLIDVGLGGCPPEHTVNYYLEKINPVMEEWRTTLPDEDKDLVDDEYQKELENCYLCSMMLERYENSIQTSQKAVNIKAKRFKFATYFLLVGLYSAIGWLGIQLIKIVYTYLPIVTNHV